MAPAPRARLQPSLSPSPHPFSSAARNCRCDLSPPRDVTFPTSPTHLSLLAVVGSSGHRSVGVQCVYSPQCLLTSGKNDVSLFLSSSLTLFVPTLLSLAAHPPWTGAQGTEETEGGSQANACCRCDLGLLAGTPGTQQPPRSTAPPSPSPPPTTHPPHLPELSLFLSFFHTPPSPSLPTSVCDGIVFKPLPGFHPRG